MSYLVLARKYRPQSFEDVLGQDPVIQTLKSAIQQGRVAHAYLFAGPRGTGKTSTARILSKALNCEKGPTAGPCQDCTNCREITIGSSLDVIEIDGASNRGIDEVRALRENVKFSPARSRYKIYIIDEVHSLTPDAFNALLKTLEEPPPHVKFIFATTEAHRVLATILSRCQRFDFRRIPVKLLTEKLSQIARAEEVSIDRDSLHKIAVASAGSLRDAQTILDQLGSYGGGKVGAKDVDEVLGIIDTAVLEEIFDAIHERNSVKPIGCLKNLIDEGIDLAQLTLELLGYARNLLMSRIQVKNLEELLEVTPETLVRIEQNSEKWSVEELLYIIHALVGLGQDLKRALSPRILVEVTLIRLANTKNWIRMDEIVSRLEELEQSMPDSEVDGARCQVQGNIANPAPSTQHLAQHQRLEHQKINAVEATLEKVRELWPQVLLQLKSKKMSLASALQSARPTELAGKRLKISLGFGDHFYKEIVEQKNHRQLLEQVISDVLGSPLVVEAVMDSLPPETLGQPHQESRQTPDPLLQSALEVFGGRIVRVETPRKLESESPPNE